MKNFQSPANWLAFMLASMFFFACTREDVHPAADAAQGLAIEGMAADETGKSPAAHIAASEKLSIPYSVDLPANLPNGNTRVATYYAVGVQKYKARIKPGSSPAVLEWTFVAPLADLFDSNNNKVGLHGAGPFWTVSPADSIFAQHFSPARTAPSEDPGSIDWLLLMPKAGTTATGIFAGVDYIQRIATKGGKAPLTPPVSITDTVDVKYKAVYRLSSQNL